MTNKILVTGGLGLIGHTVVQKLQSQGHDVVITDICTNYGIVPQSELDYLIAQRRQRIDPATKIYAVDIADQVGMDNLLRSHKPDVIVHMASFPRQKVVNTNPSMGSRTMSEGLLNTLELSIQHEVSKFVYISSSMVYGDFTDNVQEDAPCQPQGQYGIMKYMGEKLVEDYARQYGFEYVIIRPSAVYGELDVEDRVVSKFMLGAMRGDTLKVKGANEVLDFTYVQDAAKGIAQATVSKNSANKIYNITRSSQKQYTLKDAAELAISIAGNGAIQVEDSDLAFPKRGRLNIDRAVKDFSYSPTVNVEEGFLKYYNWFQSSYFWQNKLGEV